MIYIQTLPNGEQIDMSSYILKQMKGEMTREEVEQIIENNKRKYEENK
ncbi:MAG: hypothetical protein GY787_01870 [Alteromonadales bacterium]|jgi:hypothetical protein|nr:hypothetical protein [Alteromonadales bacterium]